MGKMSEEWHERMSQIIGSEIVGEVKPGHGQIDSLGDVNLPLISASDVNVEGYDLETLEAINEHPEVPL